jgi:glucose/arabinose dehydrogenase
MSDSSRVIPGLAAAACLLALTAWQARKPALPRPFATPSSVNPPRVVPRPAGAELRVPPGFHIAEYASGFLTPRMMIQGPQGELLLSDTAEQPDGAVYLLDGKIRKKLIEGLNQPYGLAVHGGYLYVGEPASIKRYRYADKAVSGSAQQVVSLAGLEAGHTNRPIVFSPDGAKMYIGVGSSSNDSPGEPAMRAAVHQYNPDGSGHVTFASGTRNPTSLHFFPGTGTLWASVQERDTLGDDLVPDYLTHLEQGGFYGWPYAYSGPNPDPANGSARPDLVKKTLVPDVLLEPAHAAVLDCLFYTGRQFPKEYQGGAFLTLHGSWNRSRRAGYSVAFIPFRDGKPAGAQRDVVSGWMLSPEKRDVWGRPVGLFQLPDGSVLVSDDGGRKIWRLSYGG